jgi:MFS family permease
MRTEFSEDSPAQVKTPWGLVLLFVGAGVVVAFQVGKVPPVLPLIRAEMGMSLFEAGWILSAFSIIGLVFGSVAGAVSDSFGHRRLLLWGLVSTALGSLAGSLSLTAAPLLATRVIEGLGLLMIAVSAPSLIVRVTTAGNTRLALAVWSCWMPAGAATIMLITPLITSLCGWRGLWQINAVVLIGYALWVARVTAALDFRPGAKAGPNKMLQNILFTSISPGPLLLAFTFSTYTLQWTAVMGFLPTLLIDTHDLSPGTASALTAAMVAINVPGNIAAGRLLQKGLPRWHLISAASLSMGVCGLIIYSDSVSLLLRYLASLAFSGLGGLLPASVLSGAPTHAPAPSLVATTNGVILQGSQLGQVTGPPAVALVVSMAGGWPAAPWLLAPTAVLGIVLSLALAALERRSF